MDKFAKIHAEKKNLYERRIVDRSEGGGCTLPTFQPARNLLRRKRSSIGCASLRYLCYILNLSINHRVILYLSLIHI